MFSPRGSVKPSFVSQLIYQTAVWLAVGWLLIGPFIQSASWLVETLVSTLYWPFDQFCFYLDFSTLWSIFWKPQLYVGLLLLAPSCWSFDRQPQFVQTLPSLRSNNIVLLLFELQFSTLLVNISKFKTPLCLKICQLVLGAFPRALPSFRAVNWSQTGLKSLVDSKILPSRAHTTWYDHRLIG